MDTLRCDNCYRAIPADEALHCAHCGKCYCEACAKKLALCECAGELSYFD